MRRAMQCVGIFAAAAVILTVIATPVLGKGGEGPPSWKTIDYYWISVELPPTALSVVDDEETYRILRAEAYEAGQLMEAYEVEGTGRLAIGVIWDQAHYRDLVIAYLYKVDKDLAPSKLLERVVCDLTVMPYVCQSYPSNT